MLWRMEVRWSIHYMVHVGEMVHPLAPEAEVKIVKNVNRWNVDIT
jgi:hypothetical protein